MGIFDDLRKLTRPYDDDEDDFIDEGEPAQTAPAAESPSASNSQSNSRNPFASSYSEFERKSSPSVRRDDKVVNINATTQVQVVLCKPERFETAAEIADHLREKRTVVMNLEQTHKDVARRLIDFLSGVAYAQDGKIKKVANSTYIITPFNVDIMGDLIDELENNGLYF
jgi:cell division inhibitor SepF